MQLWLREHNRLCDVIQKHPQLSKFDPGRQYEIAKAVVVAKMQQITVNGFLPVLGISEGDLRASAGRVWGYRGWKTNNKVSRWRAGSRVSVEFSIAYRLGHTMIPDSMGDLSIASLFDGQVHIHRLLGSMWFTAACCLPIASQARLSHACLPMFDD